MTTIACKVLPFDPEVLGTARTLFNSNFYLETGEIIMPSEDGQRPYARARFHNHSSGHFAAMPEYVHAQDSLAALAQFGYAFFMQGSVDGILTQIPRMPLERLQAVMLDKTGGAHLKRIGQTEFRSLPHIFTGEMTITDITGKAEHGYVFTTRVKFGAPLGDTMQLDGPSRHRYEGAEFQVKF
jgi:hypothetical protein